VAGVNIVSLTICSSARIQPQPDVWDFALPGDSMTFHTS